MFKKKGKGRLHLHQNESVGFYSFFMHSFASYFQPAATILCSITVFLLLVINKTYSHSKNLLVMLLVVFGLLNLNGVAYHFQWYLQAPVFHKMLLPFTLLIAPLTYLYIRSVLGGQLGFGKYDRLLALPAILYALNLFPYFTMPAEEKRVFIVAYYQNESLRVQQADGFLPPFVFPALRVIWSVIFIVLNFRIIRRFWQKTNEKVLENNAGLLRWLSILNLLIASLVVVALFAAIAAPLKWHNFYINDIALGIIVTILGVSLFVRPGILFGIYEPLKSVIKESSTISNSSERTIPIENPNQAKAPNTITGAEAQRYSVLITQFFKGNDSFLKSDFSLDSLVKETGIPRYVLSSFINREYGMGFREYLNRYRIQYLIAHFDKPEWKNFTLEAMANECGFQSRKTFINNFRMQTGKTPGEYFKQANG
jgi:AraC-like DNA-binding protein